MSKKLRRIGSETDKVNRVLLGSYKDYEQLVLSHQDIIYTLVLRQVGDPNIAYDLTLKVFVFAFRHLRTSKRYLRFAWWLERITIRICHEYFASNSKSPSQTAEVQDPQQKYISPFHQSLAQLKPLYREVVVLCAIEGHTFEGTAAILNSNVSAINSRLAQAFYTIRKNTPDNSIISNSLILKQLINYIFKRLEDDQKSKFELQISTSENLAKEFVIYSDLVQQAKELGKISERLPETFFNSLFALIGAEKPHRSSLVALTSRFIKLDLRSNLFSFGLILVSCIAVGLGWIGLNNINMSEHSESVFSESFVNAPFQFKVSRFLQLLGGLYGNLLFFWGLGFALLAILQHRFRIASVFCLIGVFLFVARASAILYFREIIAIDMVSSVKQNVPSFTEHPSGSSIEPSNSNLSHIISKTPASIKSFPIGNQSFVYAKQLLQNGQLPLANSVKPQEYLNYFHFSQSKKSHDPISIELEIGPSPIEERAMLLKLDLEYANEAKDLISSGSLKMIGNIKFNPSHILQYSFLGESRISLTSSECVHHLIETTHGVSAGKMIVMYELVFRDSVSSKITNNSQCFMEDSFIAEGTIELLTSLNTRANVVNFSLSQAMLKKDLLHTSNDFRFAAAVAAFSQVLVTSNDKRKLSLLRIADLAWESRYSVFKKERDEFIDLVEIAARLKPNT